MRMSFGPDRICYDPFTIMAVVATVTAAAGVGVAATSMAHQPKMPNAPTPASLPAAPDPNAAAQTAQDKLVAQRRTLLSSGGETNLTGPGGSPLSPGDTVSKTLLGG